MSIDISTAVRDALGGVVGIGRSTGTAVADGVVLTPAHALRHREADVAVPVHLPDGRHVEGRLIAVADDHDLAAVAVPDAGLTPLRRAGAAPALGQDVVAVAAPGGTARVTAGQIAAVGTRLRTRDGSPVDGLLEHTAPVPRGASGGPVLDADGGLVGLMLNRLEGGLYQALDLTSPSATALVDRLVAGTAPTRVRLGLAITPPRKARWLYSAVGLPDLDGVLVADAEPDGPAATAGIGRGDRITHLGGTALRTPDDLLLALRGAEGPIQLTVARGTAAAHEVEVTPVPVG